MIGCEGRSHTDWVIRCIGDEVDVCSGQFAANETDVVVVAFEPEVRAVGFVQGVSKRRFSPTKVDLELSKSWRERDAISGSFARLHPS